MELGRGDTDELPALAVWPAGARGPIENPRVNQADDDPLLEPLPGEPGVKRDGTASPLENPTDGT
jgi:hypothetical protein